MYDAAKIVPGTQETNLPDVMKPLKLPSLHSFTVIDHVVAGSVKFVLRGNSQGGFRCDSSSWVEIHHFVRESVWIKQEERLCEELLTEQAGACIFQWDVLSAALSLSSLLFVSYAQKNA